MYVRVLVRMCIYKNTTYLYIYISMYIHAYAYIDIKSPRLGRPLGAAPELLCQHLLNEGHVLLELAKSDLTPRRGDTGVHTIRLTCVYIYIYMYLYPHVFHVCISRQR